MTRRRVSVSCGKCGGVDFNKSGCCKACNKASVAKYRLANQEKIQAYHEQNKEKQSAQKKVYRAINRDAIKILRAKNRVKNQASERAMAAAYRKSNPEKARLRVAKWQKTNPEKSRAHSAKWRGKDIVRTRLLSRINSHNRRAKLREIGGKLSIGLTAKLMKLQCGKCACCKTDIRKSCHMDHVVALSSGGSNEDYNIQLLCQSCNCSKGPKHSIDFMQGRGFLL